MRRTGWAWALAAGAALGVLAACSSTPAPGDKYPTVDSFCAARAGAECGESANCATDATACATERKALCTSDASAAQAAGRAYVPGNAPACVDLTTSTYAASNVKVTPSQIDAVTASCAHVFSGAVASGGSCTADVDCKDASQICDQKGTQKYCGTKVTKNLGDFCANPGEVCATGAYCTSAGGGTFTCVARAAQGAACSATTPCLESLRCEAAVCQPRAIAGQACASNDDCDPSVPFCDVYNGYVCKSGLIFDNSDKNLCNDWGGAATVTIPSPPNNVDAGP